ncbi:hypothetical protein L873DRAFT_1825146 [Choiromyces venosus 120613-1]|uniref:Uncharacterized protein n=1 Tax=Choiromyces venosus 120613-1 TaxID=1336337 RepID=A0A3N4KAD1_9PEZI|nr:hypothetical protein L873DRAFT_1825146 [Choiromyces venosus 120613-1]
MILYKSHFGPLWITTLILSYYFLVVGGQTLGSLARNRCFQSCFITSCPNLETNCVCSGFRTARGLTEIWACAQGIFPVAATMAGFLALEEECRPFISTTTGRSNSAGLPTTTTPPRSTTLPTPNVTTTSITLSLVIKAITSTQPTNSPSLPSSSTLSISKSSSSRPSSLPSSSSTPSKCSTPTSVMNSSSTSLLSTYVAMITQTVLPAQLIQTRSPSFQTSVIPIIPPAGIPPTEAQQSWTRSGVIVALTLGPLGFLTALLALFLIIRRRQRQNRPSVISFTGTRGFDANPGSITAPLPTFNPVPPSVPPSVPLANIDTRPVTRGSQMSAGAGAGAGAVTTVGAIRGVSTRRESISTATPVSGPSRSNSQLYIFPPTSRRPSVTQRQPQRQQNSEFLRSLKKPLPQLPQLPEDARMRPRPGSSIRSSPLALPPTVYPMADNPQPMSAISELPEADRYQPTPDDVTAAGFRKVYQDVCKVLNRSPSTSTDQNSTDWSIMTDLSRNSTVRSFRPER